MNLATMRVSAQSKVTCALGMAYLCGLILSGCATVPNDPWVDLETETEAATTPLDCGKFPFPSDFNDEVVTYDKAGTNDLNDYRQCSEANEAIAGEHAKQIDQLKISRKGLTEAGQAQRRIADMKQTMITDMQRAHLWNNITLYAVIIAMGFAL